MQFPPVFSRIIADHVTHGRYVDVPARVDAQVVGYAIDSTGLEVIVVAIDGTTERPDGSVYHITWSLDPAGGKQPKDSNSLLLRDGWSVLESAIDIKVTPVSLRK